ncbi:MAG TPA: SymE family type I addiction module toxin [Clostridia bacterium]|nr:SymE family type I addiction module toxin [Clostridia bacterium]
MKVRVSTISTTTANTKEVPQIRIQGIWLDKLGFKSGKKVIIEESYGKLTLKLITIIDE